MYVMSLSQSLAMRAGPVSETSLIFYSDCHTLHECTIYGGMQGSSVSVPLAAGLKTSPWKEPLRARSICVWLCRALPGPCQVILTELILGMPLAS